MAEKRKPNYDATWFFGKLSGGVWRREVCKTTTAVVLAAAEGGVCAVPVVLLFKWQRCKPGPCRAEAGSYQGGELAQENGREEDRLRG